MIQRKMKEVSGEEGQGKVALNRVIRRIERLRNLKDLGLRARVETSSGFSVVAQILDLSPESARLQFEHFEMPKGPIRKLQILFGERIFAEIDRPLIQRQVDEGRSQVLMFELDSLVRTGTLPLRSRRRRQRLRVRSHPQMRLQMKCQDSLFPGEQIYFSVLDMSAGSLSLATSLRNRYLLRGQRLKDCAFVFPSVQPLSFICRIRSVRVMGSYLRVGVEMEEPSVQLQEQITQLSLLLMEEDELSPRDLVDKLEEAGLPRKKLASALKVDVVSTPQDYEKILKLRFLAYQAAGKLKKGIGPQDMGDEYDSRSLILALRLNDMILGTVRLVRCENLSQRFPFETYGLDQVIKGNERLRVSEVTRLAVHPDIKGTDLPCALVRRIFDVLQRSQDEALYCLATSSFQKIYSRFGFYPMSEVVPHPVLEGESLRLMRCPALDVRLARSVSAHVWEFVYRDIALELADAKVIDQFANLNVLALRLEFEKAVMKLQGLFKRKKAKKS